MTEENKAMRLYHPSFNMVRIICITLIIIVEFGLDFIPLFSYFSSILCFSHGTLFTIYGYTVLYDGADLRKNIKHTLKVFFILLLVYGLFAAGHCYINGVNPLLLLTKQTVFNFLVLNYWPISMGSSIWFVQATLYALILFWIFRKLKKFDWLFCILLFAVAILIGEFAGLIHFDVLGYTYIPGNFLTRAMPYMLLGRLICRHFDAIVEHLRFGPFFYFILGFFLAAAEFLALGFTGNLVYASHFIGFILMAASLCVWCVCRPPEDAPFSLAPYSEAIYKGMFFTYNPLGYTLLIAAGFICTSEEQLIIVQYCMAVAVFMLTFLGFWLASFLIGRFKYYDELQGGEEDEDGDEDEYGEEYGDEYGEEYGEDDGDIDDEAQI